MNKRGLNVLIFLIVLLTAILSSFATAVSCSSCSDCTTQAGTANQVITLSQDISASSENYCVDITASNVTFDCQGHSITGPLTGPDTTPSDPSSESVGIRAYIVYNATIKNCLVEKFQEGIQVWGSNDSLVFNNTVQKIYSRNITSDYDGNAVGIRVLGGSIAGNPHSSHNVNLSFNYIKEVTGDGRIYDPSEGSLIGFNANGISVDYNVTDGIQIAYNNITNITCTTTDAECYALGIIFSQPNSKFENVVIKKNNITDITVECLGASNGGTASGIGLGFGSTGQEINGDVYDNYIHNVMGNGDEDEGYGISAGGLSQGIVNVSYNTLDYLGNGIGLSQVEDWIVDHNTITNVGIGYQSQDTCVNITVQYNIIDNYQEYGIYTENHNSTFTSNYVNGDSGTADYVIISSKGTNFTTPLQTNKIYVGYSSTTIRMKNLQLGNPSTTYANFTNVTITGDVDTVQDPANLEYGDNYFRLRSAANPGLDYESAILVFKNVVYPGFEYFYIYRNNVICSPGYGCTKLSYNPVSFSVTHFSNYTLGDANPATPELSDITLLLALAIIISGFVYIKKKR